jgi:hypothetical protein
MCKPRKREHALSTFSFFETESHYVAEAGLELKIFLLQLMEFWNYSCVPPHLDIYVIVNNILLAFYLMPYSHIFTCKLTH